MAEIIMDDEARTVSAVLTQPEYDVISAAIAVEGSQQLLQLFAAYMQSKGEFQRLAERSRIQDFLDHSTDEQRTELLDVVKRHA